MAITRITAEWTGMSGAPGYTNFFLDGAVSGAPAAEAAAVTIRAFFQAISANLPSAVNIALQPQAVVIDEASGNMTGIVPFSAPAAVTGGGGGAYSAPVGAVVHWMTSNFSDGRLIRGRTFLVPLERDAYDTEGTLNDTIRGNFQTAADTLLNDLIENPLAVWSRPRAGSAGTSNVVTSAIVPDLAAILRSRRD